MKITCYLTLRKKLLKVEIESIYKFVISISEILQMQPKFCRRYYVLVQNIGDIDHIMVDKYLGAAIQKRGNPFSLVWKTKPEIYSSKKIRRRQCNLA